VNNQQILDNAPDGTTDIDDVNKYWSYQGNSDYYFWDGEKWIESWSPFHTRALADIKRIAELEKGYEKLRIAVSNAIPFMSGSAEEYADFRDAYDEATKQLKAKGGAE
jgi:hypothetical protein